MCALAIKNKLTIETVEIGATPEMGGSRSHTIKTGGQNAMPFLFRDGKIPHPPVVAYEFRDVPPHDWNPWLKETLEKVWNDPIEWANFLCREGFASINNGSEEQVRPFLFLRLMGVHPDYGSGKIKGVRKEFRRILDNVSSPLIVTGCGIQEIDRKLMPEIAEEAEGERLLLGSAVTENYREITSACIKYRHNLITESPIDINIAKQINILVQDTGLPADRIVMYATTGALGYGIEYAYSIMEKTRLVGLQGDKYMNKPQVAFVGQESWRVKEAAKSEKAGIMWEVVTSLAYLHCGADILILNHPDSGIKIRKYINMV